MKIVSLLCAIGGLLSATLFSEEPESVKSWGEDLLSIKLPDFDVSGAEPQEAIDFLRLKIKETEGGGISILVMDGALDHAETLKDFRKKDAKLGDVLRDLARTLKADIHVTNMGIVIGLPAKVPFPNAKAVSGEILKTYASKRWDK